MIEPVYEKGYPSYEAVNKRDPMEPMTDEDMVIKLHEIARTVEQFGASSLSGPQMRMIADRFSELVKGDKKKIYERVGSTVYERDFGSHPSTRTKVE